MNVLLHSDDKTVADRFTASWSATCGAVISVNREDVIISSNFDEGYVANL